jgi:hypothetical protein
MSKEIDLGEVEGIEGQWVVVHKGKVVGSSDDGGEMIRLARNYPPDETVVTKILYAEASFYQAGIYGSETH